MVRRPTFGDVRMGTESLFELLLYRNGLDLSRQPAGILSPFQGEGRFLAAGAVAHDPAPDVGFGGNERTAWRLHCRGDTNCPGSGSGSGLGKSAAATQEFPERAATSEPSRG